jgi:hypothetical protein
MKSDNINNFPIRDNPNIPVELLISFAEVPGSYLSPETGYPQ